MVGAFAVLVLTLVGTRKVRRRRDTARLESPFYNDDANTIYEGKSNDGYADAGGSGGGGGGHGGATRMHSKQRYPRYPHHLLTSSSASYSALSMQQQQGDRERASPYFDENGHQVLDVDGAADIDSNASFVFGPGQSSPGSASMRDFVSPYFDESGHQVLSTPKAIPGGNRTVAASPLYLTGKRGGRRGSASAAAAFYVSKPQPDAMDRGFVIEDPDASLDPNGNAQLITELEWRQRYYASPTVTSAATSAASTPTGGGGGFRNGQRRRSSLSIGSYNANQFNSDANSNSENSAREAIHMTNFHSPQGTSNAKGAGNLLDDSFVMDDGTSGFEWRQRYYASPSGSLGATSPFRSPVQVTISSPSTLPTPSNAHHGRYTGSNGGSNVGGGGGGDGAIEFGLGRHNNSSSTLGAGAISPAPFVGGRQVRNPFFMPSPTGSPNITVSGASSRGDVAALNTAARLGGLSPMYSPGANGRNSNRPPRNTNPTEPPSMASMERGGGAGGGGGRKLPVRKSSLSKLVTTTGGAPAPAPAPASSVLAVTPFPSRAGAWKTPARGRSVNDRGWITPGPKLKPKPKADASPRASAMFSNVKSFWSTMMESSPKGAGKAARAGKAKADANAKGGAGEAKWRQKQQKTPQRAMETLRVPGASSPYAEVDAAPEWDDGMLSPQQARGNGRSYGVSQ